MHKELYLEARNSFFAGRKDGVPDRRPAEPLWAYQVRDHGVLLHSRYDPASGSYVTAA